MAKVFEGGFGNNCKHEESKGVSFQNEYFQVCLGCGGIGLSGDWWDIRILVIGLFATEEEEQAMLMLNFMNYARSIDLIKYPPIPEDQLRRSGRKMGKTIERIERIGKKGDLN